MNEKLETKFFMEMQVNLFYLPLHTRELCPCMFKLVVLSCIIEMLMQLCIHAALCGEKKRYSSKDLECGAICVSADQVFRLHFKSSALCCLFGIRLIAIKCRIAKKLK